MARNFILTSLTFFSFFFYSANISAQSLVINEIMSSNTSTIADEDNEFPDWIELYNTGDKAINVLGYSLSDDELTRNKWSLPNVVIQPQKHLLIFASSKDRNVLSAYETIIKQGDEWQYKNGSADITTDWNTLTFDDNDWASGNSGFGYGDEDDETIIQTATSIYVRKKFTITDLSVLNQALLHIDYDDAFVAYINGIEVARSNIGQQGVQPAYDHFADEDHEAVLYDNQTPEKFEIQNINKVFISGENVLAIQVHNLNSSSSDLSLIPFLTLGYNEAKLVQDGSVSILDIKPSNLHTNFKISSSGEKLFLSSPDGEIIDQIDSISLNPDVSYGRQPDGVGDFFLYTTATPRSANNTTPYSNTISKDPVFSHAGGFFSDSFQLSFDVSTKEQIRYSTDGSEPNEFSNLYSSPINISNTTVVRAINFDSNNLLGNVITKSYIKNRNFDLPVISISTKPENLWSEETGIYVKGPNAQSGTPYFGANFWQDWEKPIHIEMYEPDGTEAFSEDAGIKIFGAWSRARDQKSLAIFARKDYGKSSIDYQIFKNKPIFKFKSFVLRNSGNDCNTTHFRDALMTSLASDIDLETQAYRPAIVFLNGEYWGIQNMREKVNEDYLAANHNIDAKNIDILEKNNEIVEGDNANYIKTLNFIKNNSLSQSQNYEQVKTMIDIENFMNYEITQIFIDNKDWPGNNIKYWRNQMPNAKWRWILYDTDFGFGLNGSYLDNTLEFALEPNGPGWPNPSWSTLLLRSFMMNESFKIDFVNRFADYLNTIFSSDNALELIDKYSDALNKEMPEHLDRWGNSMSRWKDNVNILEKFAEKRPLKMFDFISDEFNVGQTVDVNIDVSDNKAGRVKLNTIKINDYPWQGKYFKKNPIKLIALPNPGYKFTGWSGSNNSNSPEITIELAGGTTNITAQFVADAKNIDMIVINEINYKPTTDISSEDWIELHNRSNITVDLSGWILKDSNTNNPFIFPPNVMIKPNEYLVVCRNEVKFSTTFPDVKNYLGNMGFGLNSVSDNISLNNDLNQLIDKVDYTSNDPWPDLSTNENMSIELLSPFDDNQIAESWEASLTGSPGRKNEKYVVNVETLQNRDYTQQNSISNYPNPFGNSTTINYKLNKSENIQLLVYNINGQIVNTLFNGNQLSGNHKIYWNGTDNNSIKLPSGIYFVKLITTNQIVINKTIII